MSLKSGSIMARCFTFSVCKFVRNETKVLINIYYYNQVFIAANRRVYYLDMIVK